MLKIMIGVTGGVVAGYSLSRLMEARANKVVLSEAFKLDFARMLTPTATLRNATLLAAAQQMARQQSLISSIPVAQTPARRRTPVVASTPYDD